MIRTLTALVATTALLALATPAFAQAEVVECVGAKSTTYQPGLTYTPRPQHITFEASYAPCVGTEQSITSATSSDSVAKTASCLSLGETNPGSSVYRWNTGETSTFTYQTTVERPIGQLVITKRGTITSGKLAGSTAIEVSAGVTPNLLECFGGGLRSVNSTLTFTITTL